MEITGAGLTFEVWALKPAWDISISNEEVKFSVVAEEGKKKIISSPVHQFLPFMNSLTVSSPQGLRKGRRACAPTFQSKDPAAQSVHNGQQGHLVRHVEEVIP